MYKGKTAAEVNMNHIKRILRDLELGKISVKDCGLNKRFARLKVESDGWYEELYSKYVKIVKEMTRVRTS